jgi:dihydroorotate dehydrogenase electron transfer subunit
MLQVTAELVERRFAGAAQELTLRAPELARRLAPGQALLLATGWDDTLYLRRTIYPCRMTAETFDIRLLPGADAGRAWLATLPIGSSIDCLGPVGNGFRVPLDRGNLLCLAEGTAGWLLLPLVEQAVAVGCAVTLAAEASTSRDLLPANLLPAATEFQVATADGSAGRQGSLLPELPSLLRWANYVAAAGSLAFYRQLYEAARSVGFPRQPGEAQVHIAGEFLCGVGACHSCTADLTHGRRRLCQRGPVMDFFEAGLA